MCVLTRDSGIEDADLARRFIFSENLKCNVVQTQDLVIFMPGGFKTKTDPADSCLRSQLELILRIRDFKAQTDLAVSYFLSQLKTTLQTDS